MLAPSQRRKFLTYLSLPIIAGLVLLVAAKLVSLQRADIIAELADRVVHREASEAIPAVRQLAAMPGAPVEILVSAATTGVPEVAEEARAGIHRVLKRAHRRLATGRGVGRVARQLTELAESLANQQHLFPRVLDPWLARTTRELLELANQIPPPGTPLVASNCDKILAAIAFREQSNSTLVGGNREPSMLPDRSVGFRGDIESRQAHRQHEVSIDFAEPSDTAANEPIQTSEVVREPAPVEAASDEELSAPWRASWSHPVFHMMPAKPIHPPEIEGSGPANEPQVPAESTPDDESTKPPLAEMDSKALLRKWLVAEGSVILPLEEELTRRGFGRLSESLVRPLFSDHPDDRLALVDAVLTEPGVGIRQWLMVLSEDSDAGVRLLVVTFMATSNDPALLERAWQVSLHDQDPRIANLAGRLGERREPRHR